MSPALPTSVLLLAAAVSLVGGADWSYSDESHWGGTCQTGKQQSPIDLGPAAKLTEYDKFSFTNYGPEAQFNLVNNGHTVQLNLVEKGKHSLSGGGLNGVYYLEQMHFHWGAEHTLQGKRPPLELHMVHYSKQYPGVTEASQKSDGLAVVGIFFKESGEDNKHLEPLIADMKKVDGVVGTDVPMSFSPEGVMPGDLKHFYRYKGSLTTPSCSETVVWTVMTATVPISASQLEKFQKIKGADKPIGKNYRSVHPLNDRALTTTQAGVVRITPVTSLMLALALIVFAV